MYLPDAVIIPREKLLQYLLLPREENDKSAFLGLADYSLANWKQLREDLRKFAANNPVEARGQTPYGEKYIVRGTLVGPNEFELYIVTVWMTIKTSGETRFITLYPDRALREERKPS